MEHARKTSLRLDAISLREEKAKDCKYYDYYVSPVWKHYFSYSITQFRVVDVGVVARSTYFRSLPEGALIGVSECAATCFPTNEKGESGHGPS